MMDKTRRTCLLAILVAGFSQTAARTDAADPKEPVVQSVEESVLYPPVPEKISSFAAAVDGNYLYVYGGHIGEAHAHSRDNLTGAFRRLDLRGTEGGSRTWEELAAGPGLQGLPAVALEGVVYRIGGLDARNGAGEDADMHSISDVVAYDTKSGKWSPILSLPAGRSSHDAVVADGKIYVVGGWRLNGKDVDAVWHSHSLVFDPHAEKGEWKELPEQPFQRRALAAAAARGRIYAIGGMTPDGEMSSEVDVFDTATNTWSHGPSLPGRGFGVAAWGMGDEIYSCGLDGKLYRLSNDGEAWEPIVKLKTARFFHRLMPKGKDALLVIAGASMRQGHLRDIEVLALPAAKAVVGAGN